MKERIFQMINIILKILELILSGKNITNDITINVNINHAEKDLEYHSNEFL